MTLRKILPCVHELRDLIEKPNEISAYFRDFDNSILNDLPKRRYWLKRELEFQRLGKDAWEVLKNKVRVHLTNLDPKGRGWHQLIDRLNEASGYIYLVGIGCSEVTFVPEQNGNTPDLQGKFRDGSIVLCEVKTLNRSDKEVKRFNNGEVGDINNKLEPGFFAKLQKTIDGAKNQLTSYNPDPNVRRIVYIIPNFDDFLAEHKTEYYKQIDQYMGIYVEHGLEIVFHNEQGVFFNIIIMENAVVVNETV